METSSENGNERIPKARRRLWRTRLKWPRRLRCFAPEISLEDVSGKQPEEAEIAHWGEFVLLEDDIAVLHRDGTTSWLNHVITMPWGDQNLAEWDERSLVFEPRKWYPTMRRAVVHLPDGTRRKAKKLIAPVSSTEKVMSLTFAPLRPGVIVEFEEQQDFFEPGEAGPYLWGQFFLQSQVPCAVRRVTVAIAQPFEAKIELHHTDRQPVESDEHGYRVYRWELFDVPGVETDAWTPPPRDFAPWADVSTLHSWGPIARHYRKELVPLRGTPDTVKELARDLTRDCKTDREKALAVHRYTARDVRYGRHPSEQMLHTVREPLKMLEDLRGDCKDKSSLMVMMFGELNIPAKIVLVLTAQNGRTPMLPSLRFDHAIVAADLDGQRIWFDPASGPFSFGDLPQSDQGVKALMLDGDQPSWIDIPEDSPEKQRVQRICKGDLSESGDYQFRAEITAQAERAAFYRTVLQDRSDDHRRRMIQQAVAEERPGTAVDDVEVGDVEDLASNVSYRYRAYLTRWARMIEDLLLFRIPWAEPIDFSGPVSAAERLQPLQIPPAARLFERHEIDLPASFAGYGLPFDVNLKCPWAEYRCRVECENGQLVCERQMDNLGGIVSAKEFAEFKAFWEECARSDRADVVLVRRTDDAPEA
jgi:hypothetical protein